MTIQIRYLRHSYRLRWLRRTMALMPIMLIGTCVAKDTDAARWWWPDECPYSEKHEAYGGGLVEATAHG